MYKTVKFQTRGRYIVQGDATHASHIVVALHGQGMLAKYFSQKFTCLETQGYAIIVPEALHYYYLEGFSGRVGASWMTSENRAMAIANYSVYLQTILDEVLDNNKHPEVAVSVLGFSQGTATASRWVCQSNFNLKKLILWGGALPPDLEKEKIKQRLSGNQLYHVLGSDDAYLTDKKVIELKNMITHYELTSQFITYKGGHKIMPSILQQLFP